MSCYICSTLRYLTILYHVAYRLILWKRNSEAKAKDKGFSNSRTQTRSCVGRRHPTTWRGSSCLTVQDRLPHLVPFHCVLCGRNGASRSGLFCAASHLLGSLTVDHYVDVFHSTQHVRNKRPQVIDSVVRLSWYLLKRRRSLSAQEPLVLHVCLLK